MRRPLILSCCSLGAGLVALALAQPAPTPAAPTPDAPHHRNPGPFDQQILEAAQNFKHYTRVSDQAMWAPTLCRAPSPAGALRSASSDDSTHGKKLYFLFAKDAADYQASAYTSTEATTPPKPPYKAAPGQVLVKQSFQPVPVPDAQAPARLSAQPGEREYPDAYAVDHGRFYRTGEPGPLFIMLKLDPGTPDTDEGWVYANTTPDGKTITDAGRIAACMECHTKTTRDRLYGPPWSWRTDPVSNQSLPPTRENVEQVQKLREDAKVNPLPPAADLKPK